MTSFDILERATGSLAVGFRVWGTTGPPSASIPLSLRGSRAAPAVLVCPHSPRAGLLPVTGEIRPGRSNTRPITQVADGAPGLPCSRAPWCTSFSGDLGTGRFLSPPGRPSGSSGLLPRRLWAQAALPPVPDPSQSMRRAVNCDVLTGE